jgi:ADP-heptose:LPS heptosyltransferase
MQPEKLLLTNFQSLGDVLMLTAAVRDLKLAYPNDYEIHVNTGHPEIWENNPNVIVEPISPHATIQGMRKISCHYPTINHSNRLPRHFVEAFHRYLEIALNRPIPVREFKGDIYLSEKERNEYPIIGTDGEPLRYWVVISGGKPDFTAKWPIPEFIDTALEMVAQHMTLQGGYRKLKFVQIGQVQHIHPRLKHPDVIDMIGQTSIRDVLQLIYHCDGVLCPVTFAMHAAAAVPIKRPPFDLKEELPPTASENVRPGPPLRPCVVIAGGREPAHWERYSGHRFLENVGSMPCCAHGGCWRSRAQKINDGDDKDKNGLCLHPVQHGDWTFAGCISRISPAQIAQAMMDYYIGGALEVPK